ncbi:MAG: hypothetical protein ACUVR9_14025, partial [Desulfosoma sp.]
KRIHPGSERETFQWFQHRGALSEPSTLESILDDLLLQHSRQLRLVEPTVVTDAGMATEANLQMIRSKGVDDVCVDRRRFQEIPEGDPSVVHHGPSGVVKAIRSADAFDWAKRLPKDGLMGSFFSAGSAWFL